MALHQTSQAPEPVGAYPYTRRAGQLLFLSGIGPRQRGSKIIPGVEQDAQGNILSYDIKAQCHSVFKNVKTVLEESGSHWNQLLDITVFLTNMKNDFATFNQIYAEYFASSDPKPCRTTIEISSLPTPIAIELKCIALIN